MGFPIPVRVDGHRYFTTGYDIQGMNEPTSLMQVTKDDTAFAISIQ